MGLFTLCAQRTHTYKESYIVRNNQHYLLDVKNSVENGAPSRGVKGPCILNNFAKLPEQVLYCEMHVVHRGPFDDLLNLWCNSIYSDKKWYIGKYSFYIFYSNRKTVFYLILFTKVNQLKEFYLTNVWLK